MNTIPKSTSIALYLNWLMIIKTNADYTRQSTSMYIKLESQSDDVYYSKIELILGNSIRKLTGMYHSLYS